MNITFGILAVNLNEVLFDQMLKQCRQENKDDKKGVQFADAVNLKTRMFCRLIIVYGLEIITAAESNLEIDKKVVTD
jgi:hypothetical protein